MQIDTEKFSHPLVQEFIFANENAVEPFLLSSTKEIAGVPLHILAAQIQVRKKAKSKLPSYHRQKGIIYPLTLNLEQSSSEITARFKAQRMREMFSDSLSVVDLTGGFGVDTYYFSKEFHHVRYVERDEELLRIASHNHKVMAASNVSHHLSTAEAFIRTFRGNADICYVDPSRRVQGKKSFRLRDCVPDVTELLPSLLKECRGVMIKTSPLMDISQALRELGQVFQILIVSVDNDCKEVLYVCRPGSTDEPKIDCIDLKDNLHFTFYLSEEKKIRPSLSPPLKYIYEPNVAILKAGAFKSVGHFFNLSKLDPDTHLYTSQELRSDFPGRVFSTNAILKNRREITTALPTLQANLILRNFPGSTNDLKSSLGIKDGGDKYLLATTAQREKLFILADRVK